MLSHFGNKQKGVTLIEILLALAIAAGMAVIGIRQYQTFKADSDIQVAQANLDQLFLALSQYYKAHCNSNWPYSDYYSFRFNNDTTYQTKIKTGTLDPALVAPGTTTIPMVDNAGTLIVSKLVTLGYLSKWPLRPTNYINDAAVNHGYVLQYNLINSTYRNGPSDQMLQANDNSYPQMGNIYNWQMQVSALVRDTANVQDYKKMLGADCTSTLDATGVTVYPCTAAQANQSGDYYLVWTRLPSGAFQKVTDIMWQSNPQLKQFKQQYTNDSYYEFDTTHQGSNWSNTQYYLCGG